MWRTGQYGGERDPGSVALDLARLAHAQWFFGNLYEEVVRMPDRLADDREAGRRNGVLAVGSPVRYYLPVAPLVVGATTVAVARGWHRTEARGPLLAGAACTAAGAAMTGYLARTVNQRLLVGPELPRWERQRLITRWHRVNRARLVLLAASSLALRRAGSGSGAVF